jgi:ankyrin repeat protein
MQAASSHDVTELSRLIEDPHCNINDQQGEGLTALMIAADRGFRHCVQLLGNAGADVTITDDRGRTAADFAASNGHNDVSHLLISCTFREASLSGNIVSMLRFDLCELRGRLAEQEKSLLAQVARMQRLSEV